MFICCLSTNTLYFSLCNIHASLSHWHKYRPLDGDVFLRCTLSFELWVLLRWLKVALFWSISTHSGWCPSWHHEQIHVRWWRLMEILTAIFQVELGYLVPGCCHSGFYCSNDDGSGGNNWRHKTCKAPVNLSPSANQHPVRRNLARLSHRDMENFSQSGYTRRRTIKVQLTQVHVENGRQNGECFLLLCLSVLRPFFQLAGYIGS